MPAIVRDLDDDAAIILMVDANLQRETILPSERAFAYKMKLDAIKHQGERTDLTSGQLVQKLLSVEKVAEGTGESYKNVQRYIRLTELIPELLDMVDSSAGSSITAAMDGVSADKLRTGLKTSVILFRLLKQNQEI